MTVVWHNNCSGGRGGGLEAMKVIGCQNGTQHFVRGHTLYIRGKINPPPLLPLQLYTVLNMNVNGTNCILVSVYTFRAIKQITQHNIASINTFRKIIYCVKFKTIFSQFQVRHFKRESILIKRTLIIIFINTTTFLRNARLYVHNKTWVKGAVPYCATTSLSTFAVEHSVPM